MRTVRINPKQSPVSGSLTATSNRFLNYAEIMADARKRVDMEKSYQAERVITLSNSTGKQPVYMVVQTCVTATFEVVKSEMGYHHIIPKMKEVADRKIKFYCFDENKQLEEVQPTFRYNGKTLNFEELTKVSKFIEGFIYNDSELGIALYRSVSSRNKDYALTVKPFTEMVFS